MEAGWLAKVFEGAWVEVMIVNTRGSEEDRTNGSETNERLLNIFCCNFPSNNLLQWSTGLGFDGPTKKACPVVGLSRPMDKPAAKCGNCRRELRESNISRLYIEWVYRIQISPLLLNNLAGAPYRL